MEPGGLLVSADEHAQRGAARRTPAPAVNIGKADPFGLAGAFVPANQGENAAAGKASGGFIEEADNRSALNGIASPAHAFDTLTQHDNNCAVVGGLGDRHDFRGGRVPCNGRGGGGFLFLLNFIFSAENGGHRITIRNNIFAAFVAEKLCTAGFAVPPERNSFLSALHNLNCEYAVMVTRACVKVFLTDFKFFHFDYLHI